jgi:hypothetical protein
MGNAFLMPMAMAFVMPLKSWVAKMSMHAILMRWQRILERAIIQNPT